MKLTRIAALLVGAFALTSAIQAQTTDTLPGDPPGSSEQQSSPDPSQQEGNTPYPGDNGDPSGPGDGGGTNDPGGEDPPPPGDEDGPEASACPTAIVAQFPQGTQTLCMWEISDCGATPPSATGFMYAGCEGDVCECENGVCEPGTTETEIDPNDPVEVEDETVLAADPPMEEGGDPFPSGGNAQRMRQRGTDYIPTALPLAQAGRIKKLRSNKKNIQRPVPLASKLVGTVPNELTTFGKNNHEVRYLQVLKLKFKTNDEYFCLFKVYDKTANPGGGQDIASDHYVGIRIQTPSTPVPGGVVQVPANSNGRVKKLPAFDGPNSFVREAAVRIPVKLGNQGNPNKWFHIFGTHMLK